MLLEPAHETDKESALIVGDPSLRGITGLQRRVAFGA